MTPCSRRTRLRMLHTADVHLGDDWDAPRRRAGLAAVVEAAHAREAHVVLIAGDLFDNARADPAEIDAALRELARLAVPTVVTAGNHDCLGPSSIYGRVSLCDAGSHVKLLDDPGGSHAVFGDLGLTVWARATVDHHPGHNPLAGYVGGPPGCWRVVLAHGHYTPSGVRSERSSPIREEDVSGLACDYLALGHWHRFLDVSAPGVPAFYPGSPSEAGGSYPSANLVTLDPETGVSVERIALGR